MEALGFIDRPDSAATWSATPSETLPVTSSSAVSPAPTIEDAFADWKPGEVGSGLLGRNIRWSLIAGVLLIVAGLGVLGLWIYQLPKQATAAALADVSIEADSLRPHLETLAEMTTALSGPQSASASVTSELLSVNGQARALFEASGSLPTSEMAIRSLAADAAGDTLDASRLLNDALAYRAAVIPILALPQFEADPDFIQLDEAALQFGEWQMSFEAVRSALPSSVLSDMTAELTLVSGELDAFQTRYLDTLRNDDHWGARSALEDLSERLGSAEGLLYRSLAGIQTRITDRIAGASASLDELLG